MLTIREKPSLSLSVGTKLAMRAEKKSATAEAGRDLRYESRTRRRVMVDAQSVANAVRNIERLPANACSLHIIMRGNFVFSDIIPAVLHLAAPATIDYLAVTTLGFSRRAIAILLDLLDSGKVGRMDFICTDYFERVDSEICQHMREELTARGSRFASAKCHAKVVTFEMSDGRCFASEGSANIRACRNVEQFCLTQDRELVAFHRNWIDRLIKIYAPEKASR